MSHQDGFGNNESEATGLSGGRMQKKSENVTDAADGIKLKKLKNSIRLWNSPIAGSDVSLPAASCRPHWPKCNSDRFAGWLTN
jgi:hypothetical protein